MVQQLGSVQAQLSAASSTGLSQTLQPERPPLPGTPPEALWTALWCAFTWTFNALLQASSLLPSLPGLEALGEFCPFLVMHRV